LSAGAGVQWIQHVNDADDHGAAEHALSVDDHGEVLLAAEGDGAAADGEEYAGEEHAAVAPIHRSTTWFQVGGNEIKVGTLVDGLSVMMLLVVTVISLLVHIYSTDYVH